MKIFSWSGNIMVAKYSEKTIGSWLVQCKYLWTKQSSWNWCNWGKGSVPGHYHWVSNA